MPPGPAAPILPRFPSTRAPERPGYGRLSSPGHQGDSLHPEPHPAAALAGAAVPEIAASAANFRFFLNGWVLSGVLSMERSLPNEPVTQKNYRSCTSGHDRRKQPEAIFLLNGR